MLASTCAGLGLDAAGDERAVAGRARPGPRARRQSPARTAGEYGPGDRRRARRGERLDGSLRSRSSAGDRVVPVVGRRDRRFCSSRAPGVDLVGDRRVVVGEHVVDDPPRRLDAVLAGEQQRLAVASRRRAAARTADISSGMRRCRGRARRCSPDEALARRLGPRAERDRDLRVELEAEVVACRAAACSYSANTLLRRPVELDPHLGARDRAGSCPART